MQKFLSLMSDETYNEYKKAQGDLSKLSDRAYEEVKLAHNVANPAPLTLPVSKGTSRIMGLTKGLSGGFSDEISGGLEALGSVAGYRGLGGSFSDLRKSTPDEDVKTFGEVYREGRDKKRADLNAAYETNPGNFTAANFAGSLGMGLLAPAATVKAAAGVGAVMGLGESDADLTKGEMDNYKQAAIDTATGAIVGGVTQGAFNVAGDAIKAGKTYLPTAFEVYKDSQKGAVGKASDALQAVMSQHVNSKAFKNMVARSKQGYLSRMVEEGGGGNSDERLRAAQSIMDRMSDQEYVLKAFADKDPEVSKWVYAKSAENAGGKGTPEGYERIHGLGIDERNAARNFDKKAEALALKPIVDDASRAFDQATSEGINFHENIARGSFTGDRGSLKEETLRAFQDAEANPELVKGDIAKRIDKVSKIVNRGDSLDLHGLEPGDYGKVSTAEQYKRLSQARKTIDKGIDYKAIESGKRIMNEGEELLATLRDKYDEVLKKVPGKSESDAIARRAAKLDEAIFSDTEFKRGVDEFKLARLLGDNDTAGRFKNSLEQLEEWAGDTTVDVNARAKAKAMVDKMRDVMKKAEDKRAIDAFQYQSGPTTAGMQGLQSALGKQDLVDDLIWSPTKALTTLDNYSSELKRLFGKSWTQMDEAEKAAAIKLRIWSNRESTRRMYPTDEAMKENFKKFLKNPEKYNMNLGSMGGGKEPGSKFQGGNLLNEAVDFAGNRAKTLAANEAYKAVTGEEEGPPDPMKDEAAEYLKEKFNLTDEQAERLKTVMPGLYDIAGKARGKLNRVYENNIRKEPRTIDIKGKPISARKVNVENKKYSHEIYNRGGLITHVLRDDSGEAVARIDGDIIDYNGDKGFAVNWSESSTQGKGDGKRLYDLVLDTHKKVFSDTSLSPEGSHKVYADHFPYRPGVSVDLAEWQTPNRHVVRADDSTALRKDLKAGVVPKRARDYFENYEPSVSETVESAGARRDRTAAAERRQYDDSLRQAQEMLNEGGDIRRILRHHERNIPERLRPQFLKAVNAMEATPAFLGRPSEEINYIELIKAAEGISFSNRPDIKLMAQRRIRELVNRDDYSNRFLTNWARDRIEEGFDEDGFWETVMNLKPSAS